MLKHPTQKILKKLFHYDGRNLYWKDLPHPNANISILFKPAGSIGKNGYRIIGIKRKTYTAHRLIWILVKGKILNNMQIDHINKNRSDNRIKNLRLVTHQENHKNMSKQINNKSGFTGVSWCINRKKWYSYIQVNKKTISLGRFKNKKDAIIARKTAEKKYNFHTNHGRG